MSAAATLATIGEVEERKRLGQYFTGVPLARLLAALGSAASATSVLDPMAGIGDMLVAASELGRAVRTLNAVEIDPTAAGLCAERLADVGRDVTIRTANAFSPSTWADKSGDAWDLVITNPPYVRYQRTARGGTGRVAVPSATEVRAGLLEIVDRREVLGEAERHLLRALIQGYSGLADLAVPSWLLCASLVAPGGRLAMVVPDTWLSRDYALPVLYLLRRCFDIEFVVEDGDAAWFDDALVRTTLVVARRVTMRCTALADEATRHVHARLTAQASDDRSVVGSLHPRSQRPDERFAEMLKHATSSGRCRPGLEAHAADDSQFRDRLLAQSNRVRWIAAAEPRRSRPKGDVAQTTELPRRVREIVGDLRGSVCTLANLGWHVGQGLRTGANRFFYAELLHAAGEETEVQVDPELGTRALVVPNELLRIVVRKQQDLALAEGDPRRSSGRLFLLGSHALAEDIGAAESAGVCAPYLPLSEPVAEYVRRAARLDVGIDAQRRLLPELSAVVTNVRRADSSQPNRTPRFWYQLPPLAARHTGVLLVPRINHGHPVSVMNSDGNVIDANFSTLWPGSDAHLSSLGLMALLQSTWALTAMEASGTVLGGGALKVEATQLRRLPLASPSPSALGELGELGKELTTAGVCPRETRGRIDAVVWDCLRVSSAIAAAVEQLREDLLRNRNPRLHVASAAL